MQYFAFRKCTVGHAWNSILQPLTLVAYTTTTLLTMVPSDYGEYIYAKTGCSKVTSLKSPLKIFYENVCF